MAKVPIRTVVARGPRGTVEWTVRSSGKLEAKEFLEGSECKKSLPLLVALFQTIVNQSIEDEEIGPKPLKRTSIHEFIKGQVRIFCYRDTTGWVLTNGDLKKSRETPKANIARAEKIMQEDQSWKIKRGSAEGERSARYRWFPYFFNFLYFPAFLYIYFPAFLYV